MIRTLLIAAALCAPLALTGCGFSPLHASAPGQTAFSDLSLSMMDGESERDRAAGFLIEQRLRDRMSSHDAAALTLTVEPRVRRVGLGLTGLDRATRYDSSMSARWTLRRRSDGAVIARGDTKETATFSADQDPYRLLSTDLEAQERVARAVADQLLVDLAFAIGEADPARLNPAP